MNYNTENKNAYKGDWAMEETTTQKVERVGLIGISDKKLLPLALGEKTLFSDDIASSILKVLDGSQMNPEELFRELATIRGLEISKALAIVSMIEFSRRRNLKNGKSITTPADIYSEIKHFYSEEQEKMIVVALNGAHEILSTKVVTLGLINRTVVHPREVFADALKQRAVTIAIAHNHPSRNLEPSEEDKNVTDRIVKVGEILGIKVLDHLVFSDYGYYSFLEHGLMY